MIHKYKEIIHSTDRAIFFEFELGKCWVPLAMIPGLNERDNKVEIYSNFNFNYLKEEPVEDLFDEVVPGPVVKKKKIKKKDKPFNPDNIDLSVYYTDGTRIDEIPF